MRCPYCHQNIRVQGRFCPKCGEQIFGLPVRPPQDPAPPPPATAPPPAMPPGPSYERPSQRPPDLGSDTVDIVIEDEPAASRPAAPVGAPGTHAAAGEEVGKTCPYCRFPVKPGEQVYLCPACKVLHHQDCWRENQGCTTYGCRGGQVAAPVTAPPPVYGPMVGSPRGPVGGPVPDLLSLHSRELEGRANNALWLAVLGWLCCPPLTLVGLFMGLSLLGEVNRATGPTGSARGKSIGAVVVGSLAVVFWIIALIAQSNMPS